MIILYPPKLDLDLKTAVDGGILFLLLAFARPPSPSFCRTPLVEELLVISHGHCGAINFLVFSCPNGVTGRYKGYLVCNAFVPCPKRLKARMHLFSDFLLFFYCRNGKPEDLQEFAKSGTRKDVVHLGMLCNTAYFFSRLFFKLCAGHVTPWWTLLHTPDTSATHQDDSVK